MKRRINQGLVSVDASAIVNDDFNRLMLLMLGAAMSKTLTQRTSFLNSY